MSGIRPVTRGIVEWGERAMSTSKPLPEGFAIIDDPFKSLTGEELRKAQEAMDRWLRDWDKGTEKLFEAQYMQRHPEELEASSGSDPWEVSK